MSVIVFGVASIVRSDARHDARPCTRLDSRSRAYRCTSTKTDPEFPGSRNDRRRSLRDPGNSGSVLVDVQRYARLRLSSLVQGRASWRASLRTIDATPNTITDIAVYPSNAKPMTARVTVAHVPVGLPTCASSLNTSHDAHAARLSTRPRSYASYEHLSDLGSINDPPVLDGEDLG